MAEKSETTWRINHNPRHYGTIFLVTQETQNTLRYCAPFGVWIVLQSLLDATAANYAIRSAATLVALLALAPMACRFVAAQWRNRPDLSRLAWLPALDLGLFGGALVFVLWVAPEYWVPQSLADWYRTWCCWPLGTLPPPATEPSPYEPAVCGWTLTIAKLIGSAFIIAPAEEIFFRSFLYRWLQSRNFLAVPRTRFDLSAFLWMVLLFTLEHDRPLAAALCAVIYGLIYIRSGLFAAIVAHVLTNLLLALYVIHYGYWGFW